MSTPGTSRCERGFALVIVALTLVALMAFAAFAVDLGQVYVERRNDQNSADAAAMSGAVVLLADADLQSAIDEVVEKVDADLGRPLAAAEWTSCEDPNALAMTVEDLNAEGNTFTPETECISFSATFGRLRVRIPDQTTATVFGQVVGIDSFTTSAFAESLLDPIGGAPLPFVALDQSGQGDQICLRTDGTGGAEPPDQVDFGGDFVLDPCNEENFTAAGGARGTLEPVLYDQGCSSPGNQSIVDAIMVGVDHPLGIFDPEAQLAPGDSANALNGAAGARLDGDDDCTAEHPNTVRVEDGLTAGLLRCALLESPCGAGTSATSGVAGRLSDPSSGSTFAELGIEDGALWEYFTPSVASLGGACGTAADGSAAFYARRAALLECLGTWTSSRGVLFTEAVGESMRFGYVPRVAELGLCDTQPNPNAAPPETCEPSDGDLTHAHINSFSPIFIDGLYQYANTMPPCDNANPATPTGYRGWAIHYPGNGYDCGDSTGSEQIHRVSGIVLPCGALPVTVCDPANNPPFPGPLGITDIRLAK